MGVLEDQAARCRPTLVVAEAIAAELYHIAELIHLSVI